MTKVTPEAVFEMGQRRGRLLADYVTVSHYEIDESRDPAVVAACIVATELEALLSQLSAPERAIVELARVHAAERLRARRASRPSPAPHG